MKQKYTLTVANTQINIISEEPKEEIDAIVGVVDRRIREIHLHSKNCSRTDAAILLCLEYCAEKMELQKTVKNVNAEAEHLALINEALERENSALEREIEALRTSLSFSGAPKARTRKPCFAQIGIDDVKEEAPAPAPAPVPAPKEEKAPESPVAKILADSAAEDGDNDEKKSAKGKKKKVRAMFDLISFDDI